MLKYLRYHLDADSFSWYAPFDYKWRNWHVTDLKWNMAGDKLVAITARLETFTFNELNNSEIAASPSGSGYTKKKKKKKKKKK